MSSLDVTSDFSDNSLTEELSDNSSDKSSSFSDIKEESVLLSDRSDSSLDGESSECIRRRNPAGIAAFKKKILDHLQVRPDRQKTVADVKSFSPLKRQESPEVASVAKRVCYRASSDSAVSSADSEASYELDQMIIDASKYLDEISTEDEFYKVMRCLKFAHFDKNFRHFQERTAVLLSKAFRKRPTEMISCFCCRRTVSRSIQFIWTEAALLAR